MKRILCMLLVLIVPFIFLTACTTMDSVENVDTNISMFVLVEDGDGYKVVYHRDTKVMYTYSTGMHCLGIFTLLVDSEGNPLLYKG